MAGGGRWKDDLGGVAGERQLERIAVAGEVGCPRGCPARLGSGAVLAESGVREAWFAIRNIKDAVTGGC